MDRRERRHGCPASSEPHADQDSPGRLDALLDGQLRYYRGLAGEYLRTSLPVGDATVDRLLTELNAACERHVRGDVLELACGPGTWTAMLAQHAEHVTALDGAPEMLALAVAGEPGDNVSFQRADIFAWRPERRYDAIFFGFWLSHVPERRFDAFWETLRAALAPGGSVVFVDDADRTSDELVFGVGSDVIERVLENGRRHAIIKVPNTPDRLRQRLAQTGWAFELHDLDPLFWGVGEPAVSGRGTPRPAPPRSPPRR